jgi:hypothetical protein
MNNVVPQNTTMPRLRLPRTVFRHALINTSDATSFESSQVPSTLEEVELDEQLSPQTKTNSRYGCVYALYTLWNWRDRTRTEKNKKSRNVLIGNIEQLTEKINNAEIRQITLEEKLSLCVQQKDKMRARRILLQVKRNRKTIVSLGAYREELETVLITLDESNEQQELVASFRSANKVLKTHNTQEGNSVDIFDDFTDELHSAQQDVEELKQAVSNRSGIVDDELDRELEKLFATDDDSKLPPPSSEALCFPRAPTTVLDVTRRRPIPQTEAPLAN